MKRLNIKDKSSFCIDCEYVFDIHKPYHSRDRCNPCYQKIYLKGKMNLLNDKPKDINCLLCGVEYGTLNDKGRAVRKGSHSLCKTCYTRERRPKKECIQCGNMMLIGSNTGLCAICKEEKRISANKRGYAKKVKPLPQLDIETYEAVRRLLVRFKFGSNTLVDNFRVANIYMDINNDPVLLDTLNEETQVVEMLKNLKRVYDFNKLSIEAKLLAIKNKAEKKAKRKAEYKLNYIKYQKELKTNI